MQVCCRSLRLDRSKLGSGTISARAPREQSRQIRGEQEHAESQQERQATLADAGKALDSQREALLKDVLRIADIAGQTGSAWIGRTLFVGVVLIVVLLAGLLIVLLIYRRLLPVIERRNAKH